MKRFLLDGTTEKTDKEFCNVCGNGTKVIFTDLKRTSRNESTKDEVICAVCVSKYKVQKRNSDKLTDENCKGCKFLTEDNLSCSHTGNLLLCNGTIEYFTEIVKEYIEALPDYTGMIAKAKEEYILNGICRHIWNDSFKFDTLTEKNISFKICIVCNKIDFDVNGLKYFGNIKDTLDFIAETSTKEYIKTSILESQTIIDVPENKLDLSISELFSMAPTTITTNEFNFL